MVLTNIIFLWHLHAVINTKGKNFKLTPVVLIRDNTIDTIHQELSTKPYFIIIVVVVIIIIITTILLYYYCYYYYYFYHYYYHY